MRVGTNQPLHLTYCTNIHPGETWSDVAKNLETYIPVLKQQLSPQTAFGIGLRLSDQATREILQGDRLSRFHTWLEDRDLYVFTLNGFPYGGFHQQIVKDQVYAPDWSKPERLDYTLRLAHILTQLLPDGIDGGISTLPLSYKPWCKTDQATRDAILRTSVDHLTMLTATLVRSQQATGKVLHLDLEPEPDGLLENSVEVVSFFQDWLLPIGGVWLANELGISKTMAETHLREHIRVCYDTCHFAVEYEDPQAVLTLFQTNGIQIGKVQLSAALKILVPNNLEKRKLIASHLQPFAESTYLHQVIERHADGKLYHYDDLINALPAFDRTSAEEWRIHFHVPIFVQQYQVFASTQINITLLLQHLTMIPTCHHLEIETYTWDVLPSELKLDLLTSIQREYEWVLATIAL